jgi:tetrahydromethanopterin S-methyltransferase subunit D
MIIVGILFGHRLLLFTQGAALGGPAGSHAEPIDLYWVLFLGWYACVWGVIAVFLVYKWKTNADPLQHKYFEGLVGSMYFYHGLPTKSRIVTFIAGFFLGGVPTALALQIDAADPNGMSMAMLLITPVATLILFGAWFASRWVGTTPSGEV